MMIIAAVIILQVKSVDYKGAVVGMWGLPAREQKSRQLIGGTEARL